MIEMTKQPAALWLADHLELFEFNEIVCPQAAAELRRLHSVNDQLLEALEEVVRVFDSNPSSICDTVWVTGDSPETLYDHARAAIAAAKGEA